MKVLLLGAGGMLGTDLAATAPKTIDLLPLTRLDLDVTDEDAVRNVMEREQPAVVLNTAAYTDVDGAEREPEVAMQVNGTAPGILGRTARSDTMIVHFSTDYVFGADSKRPLTEEDTARPLNQYGHSKLEGERMLAASGARHLIIRTQWLFGLHGRSFPRTMWDRAQRHEVTRVVNDQFGRPTFSLDLAIATWRLLELVVGTPVSTDRNVLHVANSGIATWYDLARRIFDAMGAGKYLERCTTADFPRPARRPSWSALDTTRYESLAGAPLPAWENALDRFLEDLAPPARSGVEKAIPK